TAGRETVNESPNRAIDGQEQGTRRSRPMMQSRAIDEQLIHIVRAGDVPRAVSVQVTAFSADPVMRWLWPEPRDYLRHFPDLVHGFGGGAFEHETAYVTESFLGGALWLPPGVTPDEAALGRLTTETVQEPTRSECLSILEQMGAAHPEEPHWHLAFIGVDPAY